MAKAKKTKKVKEVEVQSQPLGQITLNQKRHEDCEWVFQFDEDEPQVFAWTDPEMNKDENPKIIFEITNIENSYISFAHAKSGKKFKLFVREISEEGKLMREQQREAIKNYQKDLENIEQKIDEYASENKKD